MADLDDPERLSRFAGSIVTLDSDGVLDECVRQASLRARTPLALVTFVMSKIQLFRAAVGLPPELAASRATSRCDSFCQFVVEDERPLVVTNARTDARLPQALVEQYGIAAYLGVPIWSGGQILGSLCVADGVPRDWDPELIDDLTELARLVSARLEEVASIPPAKGSAPVFLDALALEVASLADVLQRSLVEVGPLVRLAEGMSQGISVTDLARAAGVLTQASNFYADVMAIVSELRASASRLEQALSTTHPS